MSDADVTFSAEQAAAAANALRAAAQLPPERFPLPQLVAMLSDEITLLRSNGFADERIAAIVSASGADIDAASIARFYVDSTTLRRQA